MADIDRIISVTITRQTTVPTMSSFSDILIVGEFLKAKTTVAFNERVREYGSLAEMVTDGWASTDLIYQLASKVFMQNPAPNKVLVGRKLTGADGTEAWDVTLGAIVLENDNWYGLVVATRTESEQEDIADWVETQVKLCVLASADADIVDAVSGDIADYLETKNYERTAVIYHPDADGTPATDPCPDAAWMGKMFVKQPGSATWSLKTLAGVDSYSLVSGQVTKIESKNGNFYISVAGVDITQNGQVGAGEYIDVMHGMDWLKARIQNKVFTSLVQLDKVPFTSSGIDVIASQLRGALKEGVDYGILDSYSVSVPKIEDVPAVSKAARTLPNVTFTAILAGAIHKTTIVGTVTL